MDIQEEDYQKAVAVVRKCVSGSVSNLQRKLYWGYGRAASAIDRMQDEFIVSTMSASGRRDVYPEEIHELWKELQAAKAQKVAVPEGFVLVDKSKTEHWYLDEGENMWMEEPDYWLCDMDIGEVQAVKYKEHLVTESSTLYATKVWDDENGGVDTWEFFKSQDEAEKAAAHCKARFWEEEAQEQVG